MKRRNHWPHLQSRPQTRRILVAAVLASLTVIHGAHAEGPASVTTFDPAFLAGFTTLKQAAGFIEAPPHQSPTDWQPNLQLWVGVKAVEGAKRTVCFVQLTTLPPPPTNSLGQPWQPSLRTNHWSWSPSNHNQFVTTLYPVRARVFDETGRQLKEGQTPMAWGMLTNGLMDLCRLGFEANHLDQPGTDRQPRPPAAGKKSGAPNPPPSDELMRAMGGGFLWMMGMFGDLQTVPAVADVWARAQCAFRWPSLWTVAKSVFAGFTLSLEPRLKEVTLAPATPAGPLYRLPVDLNSDRRNLSRVEIIVGPAHGAEMLLAGIRSIHAVHPAKPKQEFFAQVLPGGTVREEK